MMRLRKTRWALLPFFAVYQFASPVQAGFEQHALRVLRVNDRVATDPEKRLSKAGTAILAGYKSKADDKAQVYLITAYHVVLSVRDPVNDLEIQLGWQREPAGRQVPITIPLRDLAETARFQVDPDSDVCVVKCKQMALDDLRRDFQKLEIPLKPVQVNGGDDVIALGNSEEQLFPGPQKLLPFDQINVPGNGFIESVRTAGELLGDYAEENTRTTRLIVINSSAIKRGFSGGPVFHRLREGNGYELIGMVEGGDAFGTPRAWAITTEALISTIESGIIIEPGRPGARWPRNLWPPWVPSPGDREPPENVPGALTTVLAVHSLTPAVIKPDVMDQTLPPEEIKSRVRNLERLRTIMRNGMKWAVAGKLEPQYNQCLVSLSNEFKDNYTSFPKGISISDKVELRDVLAFLVRDGDGTALPAIRLMRANLPGNRNNRATLELEKPRAGESLLLILRVGTQKNTLDLSNLPADAYNVILGDVSK